jgi:hypothetical protein
MTASWHEISFRITITASLLKWSTRFAHSCGDTSPSSFCGSGILPPTIPAGRLSRRDIGVETFTRKYTISSISLHVPAAAALEGDKQKAAFFAAETNFQKLNSCTVTNTIFDLLVQRNS